MNLASGPELCTEVLCIAGNPTIGAVISSFFHEEGEYFCLFEPPRMRRPDWSNEVIRRNNAAARLSPGKIILAALEQKALLALQQYFSPRITIVIKTLSEVQDGLGQVKTLHFDGEICCKPEEIAYGLLLAKKLKMKLTVDAFALSLKKAFCKFPSGSGHLIVVEDSGDFAPIIAANYAFSVNADLKLVDRVTRQDVEKVYDELLDRRVFRASNRGKRAETTLKERSTKCRVQVATTGPDFITFVTEGIPYGYFLPDIPSTHLFSYPDLGLNIFAGIYYTSTVKATRSAVVIDPGDFKDSESDFVVRNLRDKGVFVKNLKGDQARVYEVRNHIQYYPYDLLYICSHAGEMEGRRFKVRFTDRHGQPHIFVVDHAAGFGPTGEGKGDNAKIEVVEFTRFVELDGVDWNDDAGKQKIRAGELAEDFTKTPVGDWEIVEGKDIPYVKDCVALKLFDHYCVMLFHSVADHELPIIFNNACVSFYNFSARFLFADARAYIGTLTPVSNALAKAIAEEVFESLNKEKPLSVVLWEAQRRVCPDPLDRSYIHVGCHFTNIVAPDQDMTSYMRSRLRTGLERWIKKQKKAATDAGVKDNTKVAIKFLTAQIADDGY